MLNLFILPTCPYCQKVINYLNETKLDYKLLDISETHYYDELIQLGGKRQVPFLFDGDKNVMLYESDDIIEYLKTL